MSPAEIEAKYGLEAYRIRRVLKNRPDFLDGVIKKFRAGSALHAYLIPESEVPKLMFLKRKKKND